MNKSLCLFFIFIFGCSKQNLSISSNSVDIVSFYEGYKLWNEKKEHIDSSCNFEQVLRGISSAERGDSLPIEESKLELILQEYYQSLLMQKADKNLRDCEFFLKKIAKDPHVKEIVPQKLYYKKISDGNYLPVIHSDRVLMSFSITTLENGNEIEIRPLNESPSVIELSETIPGFSLGVQGMLEGEERILYIHPDLGYGGLEGRIGPNNLLIMNVRFFGIPQ